MTETDPLLTPPEGVPRSTDEVDEKLKKNLRAAHQTRWVLVAAVMVLLAGAVAALSYLLVQQQKELSASCQVWRSLAPQPVTINPQTGQPTRLGVAIIAGARNAYAGQHCGPALPAEPTVVKWARIYHIHLP